MISDTDECSTVFIKHNMVVSLLPLATVTVPIVVSM